MANGIIITLILAMAIVAGVALRLPRIPVCSISAAKTQIEACAGALGRFEAEHGRYPATSEGLSAIRPYMEKDIPPDPWGRAYIYRGSPQPTLMSYGADGLPGGSGVNFDWGWTTR